MLSRHNRSKPIFQPSNSNRNQRGKQKINPYRRWGKLLRNAFKGLPASSLKSASEDFQKEACPVSPMGQLGDGMRDPHSFGRIEEELSA